MNNKHHTKNWNASLGTGEAKLLIGLLARGKRIFTTLDAQQETGRSAASLRNSIHHLSKKGFLTTLQPGLHAIVPLELVKSGAHMGSQYVAAREVIKKSLREENPSYFFSHASAMEIHQMATQPQFDVYATVSRQILPKNILGTECRFITTKEKYFFGLQKHWISETEMVIVSDLEKTIIDGLRAPAHCGGLPEVARAFWIMRGQMSLEKLLSYAEKIEVSAVCGRLGFILETFDLLQSGFLPRIQAQLNTSYALADPSMPAEGAYISKWKLRINISPEELRSIVRT
jgi:predicted transcriptional regulator of viral defense system